jgi:N-methylhydantoinase B
MWQEQAWIELSREGDRHVYRNVLRLTKKDGKLIFDNAGTDPQIGSINCAAIAWKGAIASMISAQMLFDQMFVIEGAYRHIEFDPEPGTITCATFPAGVISAPPIVLLQTIGLAGLIISRMLYCSSDQELRKEVQSCMGTLMFPIDAIAGTDQRGNPYASFLLDPVGAALGALSWKDGVNTGGWPWDLQSTMPNVEDNELFYPLLYLWRKEIPNSGGGGKYRGGNSAEIAYVLNDTDSMAHYTTGGHTIVPGAGLFGGDPTSRTRFMLIKDARVRQTAAASGRMPASLAEIGGEHVNVPPKAGGVVQQDGDVFSLAWTSAAGYGDPLDRDPALVVSDIGELNLTPGWASARYGVCLNEHGALDADSTRKLRSQIIHDRLGGAADRQRDLEMRPEADDERAVSEGLVLWGSGTDAVYVCRKCRSVIQPAEENFKSGCARRTTPVEEVGLAPIDPRQFIDDELVYREYFCPGCGLLFQGDFTRKEDPDIWDIRLFPTAEGDG